MVVPAATARPDSRSRRRGVSPSARAYPTWFFLPAAIIFGVAVPRPDVRIVLLLA